MDTFKYLLLLRHAKSSWKNLSLSDHDRPLNKRGRKNAPVMGERLAIKNIKPELIISSSAKRAYTTAQIIANKIDYPENLIKKDKRIFHASPNHLIKLISQCDDHINRLMFVGHNPGLTYLCNILTANPSVMINNIPTTGLVTIKISINRWDEILLAQTSTKTCQATLIDFDYPKLKIE